MGPAGDERGRRHGVDGEQDHEGDVDDQEHVVDAPAQHPVVADQVAERVDCQHVLGLLLLPVVYDQLEARQRFMVASSSAAGRRRRLRHRVWNEEGDVELFGDRVHEHVGSLQYLVEQLRGALLGRVLQNVETFHLQLARQVEHHLHEQARSDDNDSWMTSDDSAFTQHASQLS